METSFTGYLVDMIHTLETIHNPVEWSRENIKDTTELEQNGFQIVTSRNIDFMVTPQESSDSGVLTQEISPVLLGSLYMHGVARGIELADGVKVQMDWFPSPGAANDLSEEFGLTPGEDVLRFVHSDQDIISESAYNEHLKHGEYPQSIGDYRFMHDRDATHALGVYFLPEEMFINIAHWKDIKNRYVRRGLSGTFDSASFYLPSIVKNLVDMDFTPDDEERVSYGIYIIEEMVGMKPEYEGKGLRGFFTQKASHGPIIDAICRRYEKIQPNIERLQSERKSTINVDV